jgi:hypothetical protein
VAPLTAEQIAASSRLTASTENGHDGSIDLSGPTDADPGRYWLRVVWRDHRLGTDEQPDEPEPLPDLDGIEWWIDGRLIVNVPVPQWDPWDEWGGFLLLGQPVDLARGSVVKAVVVVNGARAEIHGSLVAAVEAVPPFVTALVKAGADPVVARLVHDVASGRPISIDDQQTILDGLVPVDTSKLPPDVFGQTANVAVGIRRAQRAAAETRALAGERWNWGVHGEAVSDGG